MAETTSGRAPSLKTVEANTEPVAAGSTLNTVIGESPIDGIVTGVSYTPLANVTGNTTNTRTLTLINKGQDGNGTTVVATLALITGTDMADFDEKALTLSAVANALTVAAGDVLAWTSVFGGAGVADPGGRVKVEIARD